MADAPAPPDSVRNHQDYRHTHDAREEAAAEARSVQAAYRKLIGTFICATAIAAIVGGLVLYGADSGDAIQDAGQSGRLKQFVISQHVALRLCQAAAVALAACCAYILNTTDYVRIWRDNREKAESLRCERARVALRIGHDQGASTFGKVADWLVADLMEGQLAYLNNAIQTHQVTTRRFTLLGGAVMAIAAFGPIVAAAGLPLLILLGALAAVVTPALLSGLRSWGEATGSAERLKLHKATRDLLRDILRRRAEFDQAVSSNDLDAALRYVNEICAALRTDVDGFLRITGGAPQPQSPELPKQV